MSKELVISSTAHETRVAILEDDRLAEIYVERVSERALAGSIYKGRVNRVLPGMQSAFVKLGLERDAFLYVSDVLDEAAEIEGGALDDDDEVLPAEKKELSPGKAAEAEPSDDSGKGRDGRRRSRRRRGRGGKFPDSKYASADKEEASDEPKEPQAAEDFASPDAAETDESAAVAETSDDDSMVVLPGESLAKYSETSADSSDEEGEDDLDPEEDSADDSLEFEDEVVVDEEDEPEEPEVEQETELVAGSEADEDDSGESDEDLEPEGSLGDADIEASADEDEAQEDSDESVSESEEVAIEASGEEGDAVEAPAEGDSEAVPGEPVEEASVRSRSGGRYLRRGRGRRGRGRDDATRQASGRESDQEERKSPEKTQYDGKPKYDENDGPRPQGALISDLLKPGQEVIVQISKEPLGKKGARVTAHVALPGRYLVYMPTVAHVGVSRKIGSAAERARLRSVIKSRLEGIPGGFIVRTAGQGASDDELNADIDFLSQLWTSISEKAEKRNAPAMLHADLDVSERILRDHLGQSYKTIWVDSEEQYERTLQFVERFQPELLKRVKLYTRATSMFDEFNISNEIDKAMRARVWLKSGGYIVINHTEALVAIDVNTGKYVGKSDRLEDTIVKTNLEAVEEVVKQLRLRDLGGIIVVDFIDMEDRKNRLKVMQSLEKELQTDRAPSKALAFNEFGLVCITRKRVKQSLEKALCSHCPTCEGSGLVKSVPTVIFEILSEGRKLAANVGESKDLTLRVHPDIARKLKSRDNSYLQELEELLRANVFVRGDGSLHRENFDIH